ncbi:MAG: hypothetical protein WA991_08940 [Ornithinimicrobium sp.]
MSSSDTEHDPKEPLTVKLDTSEQSEPDSDTSLTQRQRELLIRVLRLTYPHPGFPDAPYQRTADAVVAATGEDAALRGCLAPGLDDLDAHADGDFMALGDEHGTRRLRELTDDPWFVGVRATSVVALYDDTQVWEVLGYEGASYDHGGYLHRGFDDLDWLPDPRIEEHPDLQKAGQS